LSIYGKAKDDNSLFSLLHHGFCLPPYSHFIATHTTISTPYNPLKRLPFNLIIFCRYVLGYYYDAIAKTAIPKL
jgi:hypothetical protein